MTTRSTTTQIVGSDISEVDGGSTKTKGGERAMRLEKNEERRLRFFISERVKMSDEDIWAFELKRLLDGLIIFQPLC